MKVSTQGASQPIYCHDGRTVPALCVSPRIVARDRAFLLKVRAQSILRLLSRHGEHSASNSSLMFASESEHLVMFRSCSIPELWQRPSSASPSEAVVDLPLLISSCWITELCQRPSSASPSEAVVDLPPLISSPSEAVVDLPLLISSPPISNQPHCLVCEPFDVRATIE